MKPSHYRIIDLRALIQSGVHIYYREITEPFNVHYQNMKQSNSAFEVTHIDMYKDLGPNNTASNAQSSQKLARRIFPLLPFSEGIIHLLKKINIQYSDLNDSERKQLCKMLVENKHCYATHRNSVGRFSTPFQNRFKPYAELHSQKPIKIPSHYRNKPKTLLDKLLKNGLLKQIS